MDLVSRLRKDYPSIRFTKGQRLHWAPRNATVSFLSTDTDEDRWGILHELGHALLDHKAYTLDVELLRMEMAAWSKAEALSNAYSLPIDQDYIQDCLDSYRDWLERRSLCPTCRSHGLQEDTRTYRCYNCRSSWHVSNSRFCRAYRRTA